eukprot:Pgem_evm1s14819
MWYTDRQRQALRYACEFAGINVARVYNDTTAAALAYGIYKAGKLKDGLVFDL